MANEKNLIPQAHTLTVEEQSKGGVASGIARREARTMQKILRDFLDESPESDKQISEIASKMGLKGAKSIKEVCTLVYLLNTLKEGKLSDLEQLMKLAGEKVEAAEDMEGTANEFNISKIEVMGTVNDDLPEEDLGE